MVSWWFEFKAQLLLNFANKTLIGKIWYYMSAGQKINTSVQNYVLNEGWFYRSGFKLLKDWWKNPITRQNAIKIKINRDWEYSLYCTQVVNDQTQKLYLMQWELTVLNCVVHYLINYYYGFTLRHYVRAFTIRDCI